LKTYRPAPAVIAEIERLLAANQPAFHQSPLDEVIEVLSKTRHYAWIGIYLAAGDSPQLLGSGGESGPTAMALPQSRTRILVSMKIAGRELGMIAAESDEEYAFGREDRVLLENVANLLARFLSGRGKYLVRRTRERARQRKSKSPEPASLRENKLAAAS
jgi:putative methionine-R-sulfoxide reductase with GAF domain